MYTLEAASELMKNQKAAQVLSAQSSFQVLQTSEGQSLFFSIGDTSILYLSAEQNDLSTGWLPIDLTTELGNNYPGQTIVAKAFAVCQSVATGNILVAQVIHAVETNTDSLYLLSGLSDAPDAAWLQSPANRTWISRPYDDSQHPVGDLAIDYVNIPLSQDPTQTPYVVAGIQSGATAYIQNYVVDINPLATGQKWNIYQTAENYDALQDMRMGRPKGAIFPGLYEIYTLNAVPSLTFTPIRGLFGPPNVTKLTPPTGATSLAVVPADSTGLTNLYVAGTGAICLYTADNQGNFSKGVEVIIDDLIAGVESLEAHLAGSQITLWGKNGSGVVFYSRCDASSQADAAAWSAPIPIQQGVDQLATMLDLQTQSSVLYAHTAGQELVKLTQDPVTTQWRSQSILLPQLNMNTVSEFYTYTTHVKVTDENSLPLANQTISLTATSPGSIYVNDTYMTLWPTRPLDVQSDFDGTVTLVQETQTLGAICYNLVQGDGTIVNVNPMNNGIRRMSGITNGTDLGNVKVTDERGNTSTMVPGSVPQSQTDAVAQGLVQFVQTAQVLPQDGSLQTPPGATRTFDVEQDASWGMSFADGGVQFFEGIPHMTAMGLTLRDGVISLKTAKIEVTDINDAIPAFSGDIFSWIEKAGARVEQFFVQIVDGVTHFFIQIGKSLYHFVMKCINDVVHGIQFIFNKIEVTFERLVQWIGFIFSFDDILRTHNALKNIFKQYALFCGNNVGTYRAALKKAFTDVEDSLNQFAGLPDVPGTAAGFSSTGQKPAGSDSPQSHYGSYHAKSNATSAVSSYQPPFNATSELEQLLKEFLAMLQREEETFTEAYENLKTQIIDQLATLSIKEIVTRLLVIIFDVILESTENAILTIVDIMAILVEGATAVLDAPIEIPVLSWFYKQISGNDLSILDLACLIVAIPVTIVCKLETLAAPFPDDDFTTAIINAPDFATIQSLYQGDSLQMARTEAARSKLAEAQKILGLSAAVAAYFGAIGVMGLGTVKFYNPNLGPVAALYAVAYLFYVAPDVTPLVIDKAPTWDVAMNGSVCAVSVLKTLVDIALCKFVKGSSNGLALTFWNNVSPAVEAVINAVWQAPVVGSLVREHKEPSSIVAFIGNTSFDAGGWITPGTFYPKDEKVRTLFFLGTVKCSAIYGELMLVQGLLAYKGV